ncbi:hypothetical protein ABZ914_16045 [Spirillospora sp. NPDC046719]
MSKTDLIARDALASPQSPTRWCALQHITAGSSDIVKAAFVLVYLEDR